MTTPGEDVRNFYRNQGIVIERERIIELLEADICLDWNLNCCDGACSAYKDAISLIKGAE